MPRYHLTIAIIIGALSVAGCAPASNDYKRVPEITGSKTSSTESHDHDSHAGGHTHYGAGPHGGSLIELGGDDYHAELVVDHDAHALRIFLLKSDAKTPLPSAGPEVTLALDSEKKLTLKAVPLEGESEGQSSRFELIDDAFIHRLVDQGFLHGDLSVPIGDKVFRSHLDIHFEHGDSKPDHKHGH